ncbi:unnamed protein product, partial [Coregonus sp. 'balchen']
MMQDLQELMGSFTGPDCHVTPKVTWAERQTLFVQNRGEKREAMVDSMLSLLKVPCWASVSIATVRMRLCGAEIGCPGIFSVPLIHQDDEGFLTKQCVCPSSSPTVTSDKQVILIGIKGKSVILKDFTSSHMFLKNVMNDFLIMTPDSGRDNLSLLALNCSGGWLEDELVKSGFWPATVTHQTTWTDLFKSSEDMKVLAPGCSRQAFVGMI